MPWVSSPCSPRLSPWSAVTRTRVGEPACRLFDAGEGGGRAGRPRTRPPRRRATRRPPSPRPGPRRARAGRSSAPTGRRASAGTRRRGAASSHRKRGLGRPVGGPLDVGRAARVLPPRQLVVVGVEAPVEAEATLEGEAGDEAGGAVAGLAEVLGHAAHALGQDIGPVVAHAVAERGVTGQDRGVRGRRERGVGDGDREQSAPRRQAVEVRGDGRLVAVASEAIRAKRVDRHQQDVGRRGGPGRLPGAAGGHGEGEDGREAAGEAREWVAVAHRSPLKIRDP